MNGGGVIHGGGLGKFTYPHGTQCLSREILVAKGTKMWCKFGFGLPLS